MMQEQGIYGTRFKIREQLQALAEEHSVVIPDDDQLFREVENLVETPTAFIGNYDAKYLELPRDVLETVMRKHQRYFVVEDANGQLLNKFIGVRNGGKEHLHKVICGNEQVLRARFDDAHFFFSQDIKKRLSDYFPRLETLTFQAVLGSMRDKNDRVASTVGDLGKLLSLADSDIAIAREAAGLSKADLATSMVVEMTSLQGIMGREYALREGIDSSIATAIREHWLPAGLEDSLPTTNAGTLLAITDKLDSLVGLLAVGLAPKPTSDPYGLRRIALGILRILIDKQISLDVRPLIDTVASNQPVSIGLTQKQRVADFLRGRLDHLLTDTIHFPKDVVNAVLMEQSHNPFRAVQGVDQLATWVKKANWESILDSFARCVRITRSEQPMQVNPDLFSLPEEKTLYAACLLLSSQVNESSNIGGFLSAFECLTPAVTAFFDNVLVHTDDLALRNNRIALLQRIAAMQNGKADLSELENF